MTDEDIRELFDERASIREFEGQQTRGAAERAALMDVRNITGDCPEWLIDSVLGKRVVLQGDLFDG